MSTLHEAQVQITMRMRRGESFAAVETDVIDPAAVSEAEKAALWLYGWSFVHWRRQRREALRHIERLDARGDAPDVAPHKLQTFRDRAFAR